MEITINKKPCILLEATELMYGYVNEIPAEKLTSKGKYCIPPEDVQKIQEVVCAELDREDEELQFYFHGIPVDSQERRQTCLARCLLYTCLDVKYSSVDELLASAHQTWHQQKKPFLLGGIDEFALSIIDADHYTSISKEVGKLPIPQYCQMQLIEVLSSFDWHLDRVVALLRPVAERLEPLLDPWVTHAAPLAAEWEKFLNEPSGVNTLLRRTPMGNLSVKHMTIALRYLSVFSCRGLGRYIGPQEIYSVHMNVCLLPGEGPANTAQCLESTDFSAFRLLSSSDRVRMLHAMMKRPMSVQDLCHSLGLNPGTVFRDLNNLYNVGLLTLDMVSGRNCYTTNLPAIERLTNRLIQYLKQELN